MKIQVLFALAAVCLGVCSCTPRPSWYGKLPKQQQARLRAYGQESDRAAARFGRKDPILHVAVAHKDYEIVAALIRNGGNVNEIASDGNTALCVSAMSNVNDADMTRILLANGADPNISSPLLALTMACGNNNVEMVRELLTHGADPNKNEVDGMTPLMVTRGHDVAVLLLNHGAQMNAKSSNNKTPVMFVCENPDLVTLFLDQGADPNVLDAFGETALDIAMKMRYTRSYDILKKRGAKSGALGVTPAP